MSRWSRGSKKQPPEEERVVVVPQPTAPPAPTSPLSSDDPEELKAALRDLIEHGVPDSEVDRIHRLIGHQDAEVRLLMLRAMENDGRLSPTALERALDDPIDEVRAAAVRVAAADPRRISQIVPLVGQRQWPLVQTAALEVLPGLVRESGSLAPVDVTSLTLAVAGLSSPPLERERVPFGDLARAVGVNVLVGTLPASDARRLGAARLLMAEGSSEALGAVAEFVGDEDEEIRAMAEVAEDLLGARPVPDELAGGPVEEERPVSMATPSKEELERSRIEGLAAALLDPDDTVRDRAMTQLEEPGWGGVLAWVKGSLTEGDAPTAALAAHLAGRIMLSQEASRILQRAAEQPVARQGPFIRSLASFELSPEALVGLLADIDPVSRADALPLIWELGGRPVLPLLSTRMPDQPREVRVAALRVFEQSWDPVAYDLAERVLANDPSPIVRAEAVRLLSRSGPERRLSVLRRALLDPQPSVRVLAVESLPGAQPTAATPLLFQALDDPDDRVGTAAVPQLAALIEDDPTSVWVALKRARPAHRRRLEDAAARRSPDGMRRLRLSHLASSDASDRSLAVELGFGGRDIRTTGAAVEALRDPDAQVRLAGARVLAAAGAQESVPELGRALGDPNPDVRIQAVRALADQDEQVTLNYLVDALGDPDQRVAASVFETLERLRSRSLADRLISALDVDELRGPTGRLLVGMGPFVVDLLVDALPRQSSRMRRRIGELLERIVGLEEFRRRLTSTDRQTRAASVDAIASIGGEDANQALAGALADPDEGIRLQALMYLGESDDGPHVADAVRWTAEHDPVPEVAERARETLARLGTSSSFPPYSP